MRKCTCCNQIKEKSEFQKNLKGLRSHCKKCRSINAKEYKKTKFGLILRIYNTQKRNSKKRGHPLPSYTKEELYDWIMAQKLFHHIYNLWKVSDYNKLLIPSVDRINDKKPYDFNNIQLMTWEENNKKGWVSRRRKVIQYSLDDKPIAEYESLTEAAICVGVEVSLISSCCSKKTKTAHKFKWEYASPERKLAKTHVLTG